MHLVGQIPERHEVFAAYVSVIRHEYQPQPRRRTGDHQNLGVGRAPRPAGVHAATSATVGKVPRKPDDERGCQHREGNDSGLTTP